MGHVPLFSSERSRFCLSSGIYIFDIWFFGWFCCCFFIALAVPVLMLPCFVCCWPCWCDYWPFCCLADRVGCCSDCDVVAVVPVLSSLGLTLSYVVRLLLFACFCCRVFCSLFFYFSLCGLLSVASCCLMVAGCSAFGSLVTLWPDLRHGLFFLFCRCSLFSVLSYWCSFLIVLLCLLFFWCGLFFLSGFILLFLLFLGSSFWWHSVLGFLFFGVVSSLFFWSPLFMLATGAADGFGLFFFRWRSNRRSCFPFPSLDSFFLVTFFGWNLPARAGGLFPVFSVLEWRNQLHS